MYHFTANKLYDGRPIPAIGEWLEHTGELRMYRSGLHACIHPFDALNHAPGPMLHKVELESVVHSRRDSVGRRRKITASIDATELLHDFAQWCALQVVDEWDAPDVVHKYLETSSGNLRVGVMRATARLSELATRASKLEVEARKAAQAARAARAAARSEPLWAARSASLWARASVAGARATQRKKFKQLVDKAFGDILP